MECLLVTLTICIYFIVATVLNNQLVHTNTLQRIETNMEDIKQHLNNHTTTFHNLRGGIEE